MNKVLGKSVLTLALCGAAFVLTYGAVRQARGESGTGEVSVATATATATPDQGSTITPAATSDSDSTATPEAKETPSPQPTQTVVPDGFPPIEELGEAANGGTVFDKWGIRFNVPDGYGEYRVIYPLIVDGPGTEGWGIT